MATEIPHLFYPGVHEEALTKKNKTINYPQGITSLVKVNLRAESRMLESCFLQTWPRIKLKNWFADEHKLKAFKKTERHYCCDQIIQTYDVPMVCPC